MKRRYTVIAVLLTVLIGVSLAVDFNLHLNLYFSNLTSRGVEGDVIENVAHINSFFDEKLKLAEYIAELDEVKSSDAPRLNLGTNIPGFLRMNIYDAEGNGYCNGKFLGNFSDQEFFQNGMNGKNTLYVDSYTGDDEFVFCVPIIGEENNITAVFAGVCSSKTVYDHMMINSGATQRIFIYDTKGRSVLSDPNAAKASYRRMTTEDGERVINDIRDGNDGICSYSIDGEKYYSAYAKLKYNDWYVFVSAMKDEPMQKTVMSINAHLIGKIAALFAVMIAYFFAARRAYKKQVAAVREETALLAKTIPGSTMMCRLDELLTITYASEAVHTKLGYACADDKPSVAMGLRELIHPDDLKGFNRLYDEYRNSGSRFEYECRFICQSGKPKWMKCYARFIEDSHAVKKLYIVAIDISDRKEAQLRLRVSQQRYKAVVEQSNSVVFEYNIKTHDYYITNNFYEQFNLSGNSADVFAVFMKQHRLHGEDKLKFEQMISDAYSRCGFREEELRIIDASKKYTWYSMKITSLSDAGSMPTRIIGNLANIDAIKKSTLELEVQAQTDILTNCYNRETSLALIRRLIENETEDTLSAIIVIDIDRFREINDSCGHEVGDELLRLTARMLKGQVRASDIVGRIGDDEFIVFLRGCSAVSQIVAKVESFIDGAHKLNAKGYNKATLSIGAAMYPTNSRDYDSLYDMADKAVYISKTTGCDRYTLYRDDLA